MEVVYLIENVKIVTLWKLQRLSTLMLSPPYGGCTPGGGCDNCQQVENVKIVIFDFTAAAWRLCF